MNSSEFLTIVKGDALKSSRGYAELYQLAESVQENCDGCPREMSASEKAMILGALVWCIAGFAGGVILLCRHLWCLIRFEYTHEEEEKSDEDNGTVFNEPAQDDDIPF